MAEVSQSSLEEALIASHSRIRRHQHDHDGDLPEDVRREGGKLFNFYFDFLQRYSKWIVLFWLSVFIWAFFTGPQFLHMGNDAQNPPKGSRSYDDQQRFMSLYTTKAEELPVILIIECDKTSHCVSVDQPELTKFANEITNRVEDYNKTHANVFYTMSYYQYNGTVLDDVKGTFMSKDKQLSYLTIVVNGTIMTGKRYDFVNWLDEQLKELNPNPKKYKMGLTGFDAMARDGVDATQEQVEQVDAFSVPVALLLLGYMVGSWRLLFVGVFNMGASILTGFAIMAALLLHAGLPRPESASAQLMQVMSMSLSIDYVLFLCRRFRDEIKVGKNTKTAIYRSLLHAGHVVMMSGITIVVVFLGFTFLPSRTVVMDGTACSIGVSVTILVALTNTPAMLLTFPKFFSTFNGICGKAASPYGVDAPLEIVEDDDEEESSQSTKVHNMYRSTRFKITRFITKWPNNIISILVLYILVIPLALQCSRLEINEDILAGIPRGSPSGDRFRSMYNHFPGGTFSPFYVVVNVPEGESVMTRDIFETVSTITERIQKETACKIDPTSVTSPAYLKGEKVTLLEAEALLLAAKRRVCNKPKISKIDMATCRGPKEYEFLFEQAVNERKNAMLISILVPFFPFATQTQDFIDQVYDIMDAEFSKHNHNLGSYIRDWTGLYWKANNEFKKETPKIEIGFCGFAVGFDAIMRQVYGLFPTLIGTTLAAVFIVLSVMLKSAFVPIRLAVTLFLPILAVYGLAVLVYQDGILNWLSAATTSIGGFYWYIPILITSMVCGLALDYDVFLISRIVEHRSDGYDIRSAIVKATCETGGTISAAGIIMTLAFGGMLLANQSTINLSGWLLATAVLLDTFVVNTILVPALMSLGDNVAWWPMKMPTENLITLDHPEFVGEKVYSYLNGSDGSEDDTVSSADVEIS